jgi:hypothetical protein
MGLGNVLDHMTTRRPVPPVPPEKKADGTSETAPWRGCTPCTTRTTENSRGPSQKREAAPQAPKAEPAAWPGFGVPPLPLVRCLDCRRFERIAPRARVGRCLAGEPPPACGFMFDTDRRPCSIWRPVTVEGES